MTPAASGERGSSSAMARVTAPWALARSGCSEMAQTAADAKLRALRGTRLGTVRRPCS
jgi:hypothetical protein